MCVDLKCNVLDCGCDTLSPYDGFVLSEDGEFGQRDDIVVPTLRRCEVFAAFGVLDESVSGISPSVEARERTLDRSAKKYDRKSKSAFLLYEPSAPFTKQSISWSMEYLDVDNGSGIARCILSIRSRSSDFARLANSIASSFALPSF